MNDFEYDCMVKKRIARSASRKKSGVKSTKCSLPSDRLTNKQWKERCGVVMSYKLGSPMSWADFKNMPKDIQSEYISGLQDKYGVNAGDIGEMFGVTSVTIRRHCDVNELGVKFRKGVSMTGEQRTMWDIFLHGTSEEAAKEEDVEEETSAEVDEIDPVTGEENTAVGLVPVADERSNPEVMTMREVRLSFTGKLDIDAVANSLRVILGTDSVGELDITFRRW